MSLKTTVARTEAYSLLSEQDVKEAEVTRVCHKELKKSMHCNAFQTTNCIAKYEKYFILSTETNKNLW